MKRVISPERIEKLCQLMIALGLLVIASVLPCWAKLTCPLTTCGPSGLASAGALLKQPKVASTVIVETSSLSIKPFRLDRSTSRIMFFPTRITSNTCDSQKRIPSLPVLSWKEGKDSHPLVINSDAEMRTPIASHLRAATVEHLSHVETQAD